MSSPEASGGSGAGAAVFIGVRGREVYDEKSPQLQVNRDMNMKDLLSRLPDEILVYILSFLRLREAGGSSVLSRRWKCLWKFTRSLQIDSEESIVKVRNRELTKKPELLANESAEFVTWVNHALRLHQSPFLDKFKFRFNLDARPSDDLDEWIKFAIRKKVKILEIDLALFDADLFSHSQKCYRSFKSSSIECLTSLSLSYINIDGELVEYLLSNCPHLERLSISHSQHLRKLKVAGTSVMLKYLKIVWCPLKSIELSAPKLATIHYSGNTKLGLLIGSNPRLSELTVEGRYSEEVTSVLVPFSSHLPQLKTLSLSMWFMESQLPQIPLLRNLKHLILDISISKDLSLISLTRFMAAAPSLVRLTLQLRLRELSDRGLATEPSSERHEFLKQVEIEGFVGGDCEFELVKFLLKHAIHLEKMVIRQGGPCGPGQDWARRHRGQVKVLRRMVPPGAELIVV